MFFLCSSRIHFRSSIFIDLGVIFDDFWHAFWIPEGIDFLMIFYWISGGVQELREYGEMVVNPLFGGRGGTIRRGRQGYIPKDIGYWITDD